MLTGLGEGRKWGFCFNESHHRPSQIQTDTRRFLPQQTPHNHLPACVSYFSHWWNQTPDKTQFQRGKVNLAHGWRGPAIMFMEARWCKQLADKVQTRGSPAPISSHRPEWEIASASPVFFPFAFCLGSQPTGWSRPHSGKAFPPQLILSGKAFTIRGSKVCLIGDSKSRPVPNDD